MGDAVVTGAMLEPNSFGPFGHEPGGWMARGSRLHLVQLPREAIRGKG